MRLFPPDDSSAVDLGLRRAQTGTMLDLGRIHAVVGRHAQALFEEAGLSDITPAQSNVLMVLFQAKRPLTAREISGTLGAAEPTVSRFLQTLERKEWVLRRRDPDDARAMLVAPSERARKHLPDFIHVSNALLDRAFAGFTPAETEQLTGALRRMTSNLAAEPASGA